LALINLFNVGLAFGGPKLLDQISFLVRPGERVCLVGRNGAGKSSLLKILAGQLAPEHGEVSREVGLRCAYLPQNVPMGLQGSVYEVVAAGLGEPGRVLADLRRGRAASAGHDDQELWRLDHQLAAVLDRLGLDGEAAMESLSGGLKRRALLARALAAQPELLLLDEPTNHLDIDSIVWLENFLAGRDGAMVFVSHDRAFARNLATRTVELDRGRLLDWNCSYDEFVQRREDALQNESERQARFDKKMAQEEQWLRRGVKARRTRDEGRVRRLMAMRAERAQRREALGSARLRAQEAGLSGKVVAELKDVSFGYGERPLIKGCNALIMRGDKMGVIGPNGSGKTTLLRLILGQLTPQSGQIILGANLEPAYFDQMRQEIDGDKSVRDNLVEGHDSLIINGNQRHVISYLQDFLFTPDRAHSPARVLSGGERNRLLLAKLFARPANLLVLDEPTNDLDGDTLDLLEHLLVQFAGTVLLVSHDRQFINNTVSCILALEGDGVAREYVGGYDDWLAQRPVEAEPAAAPKEPKAKRQRPRAEQPRRLSFKQRQELEALPARIEELESRQAAIQARLSDPEFYASAAKEAAGLAAELAELEAQLEAAYDAWADLERLAEEAAGD